MRSRRDETRQRGEGSDRPKQVDHMHAGSMAGDAASRSLLGNQGYSHNLRRSLSRELKLGRDQQMPALCEVIAHTKKQTP